MRRSRLDVAYDRPLAPGPQLMAASFRLALRLPREPLGSVGLVLLAIRQELVAVQFELLGRPSEVSSVVYPLLLEVPSFLQCAAAGWASVVLTRSPRTRVGRIGWLVVQLSANGPQRCIIGVLLDHDAASQASQVPVPARACAFARSGPDDGLPAQLVHEVGLAASASSSSAFATVYAPAASPPAWGCLVLRGQDFARGLKARRTERAYRDS